MAIPNTPADSSHNLKLDIVTSEQSIFSGLVNSLTAPGIEGELGILPHHCPLITYLQPGELNVRQGEEEICLAIVGGFLEVRPDRVIILADLVERDEMIDARKAEEAIQRAEQRLSEKNLSAADKAEAEAALRLELARLKVANKRKRKNYEYSNHP